MGTTTDAGQRLERTFVAFPANLQAEWLAGTLARYERFASELRELEADEREWSHRWPDDHAGILAAWRRIARARQMVGRYSSHVAADARALLAALDAAAVAS